ncbi:hypothetical protein BS78_05G133800 [Paspalum vaginatum]|nr:hypothetical protein BS78_05G133800 [Paspalum vaginatum]
MTPHALPPARSLSTRTPDPRRIAHAHQGETLAFAAAASEKMIYDVNSPLFRSFLSQKGSADRRKMEEHKPKEQRPKASENKPVMNE